jgi:transmembrane sensor
MSNINEFPSNTAIEEEACLWIVKFEDESYPTKHDIRQFNAWLSKSPVHRATLMRLANTWNDMDVMSGLRVPLGRALELKRSNIEMWLLTPFLLIAVIYRWLKIAASNLLRPAIGLPAMALIMTITLSFWLVSERTAAPINVYATSIGNHSTHTLQDGTVLWLNSNSQVEVNYTDSKRIINLVKGEAHFDVTSNPLKPFEVFVGNRMIKAIGTAFSVYRLDDKIQVMVTEGIVELAVVQPTLLIVPSASSTASMTGMAGERDLHTETPTDNIVTVIASLEAGQSVSVLINSNELDNAVVEHEVGELARKLSWLEGKLVFAGESLEEVVAEVSRHTPIVIEVADPDLRKLRIGGQFQAGETEALFDVLESGFGIKITRLGKGHVRLNAK